MAIPESEWVTLAVLQRTRGNRGELLAQSFTSGPERFSADKVFSLWREPDERRECRIENAWMHQGLLVLKLAGVDTIEEAEALRGCEVQVPWTERAPLAEGEFYQSDLIGCQLIDQSSGQAVAVVKGWEEFGAAPLLVVETTDGREEMVPFTPAICIGVEPAARRIVVDLPDGLLNMNGV